MSEMKISLNGERALVKEEGERLTAYPDVVGVWTIGVGHTGQVDGKPVAKGMTITQEKSREVLRADLVRFERSVNRNVTVPLKQYQFDALVSLIFNIGEGAFMRSTLLKVLNKGDYKAASEQFLVWKNAGGRPTLLARRQRERRMFDGFA